MNPFHSKKATNILTVIIILVFAANFSCTSKQKEQAVRLRQSFNSDWKFHEGDVSGANRYKFTDEEWSEVEIPHDWSIAGPFEALNPSSGAGAYLPCGIGWYRKSFSLPQNMAQLKIAVEFEGIYMNSDVWINGEHIGHRPNGYLGFQYDLTPHLNFGNIPNVISVKVDNSLQPSTRWYTGSGINRDAWLVVTNPVHIAHWGTYVTTPSVNENEAQVAVKTNIKNEQTNNCIVTLATSIWDKNGLQVTESKNDFTVSGGTSFMSDQQLNIQHPLLWSCDEPNLYEVHSSLFVNGLEVDRYITKTGFRNAEFNAESGFSLNGKATKINGICMHEDAGFLGTAYPKDVLRRRLEILKGIGCNAIRPSHNPNRPALLDLCDEIGFLVMDEAFDEWKIQKDNCNFGYHLFFDEWHETDLKDMIHRDRNHPSIILYSIGNEIQEQRDGAPEGADIAKALIEICHREDPTRPVTSALDNIENANKNGVAQLLDVVGYNYQEQHYESDHQTFPNRKIIGSENFYGFDKWKIANENNFIAGQFLWIGFDYLGEAGAGIYPLKGWENGLMDMCGFKKPRAFARQVLWDTTPQVYIYSQHPNWLADTTGYKRWNWEDLHQHWNWEGFEEQKINVKCYTNCDKVELFLNNQLIGSKNNLTIDNLPATWSVPYQSGILLAKAYKDGNIVASQQLESAGEAFKIILSSDKTKLKVGKDHVAHVAITIVDKNGVIIPDAENSLQLKLTGEGEIMGSGNGNLYNSDSFNNSTVKTHKGKALVVIKANAPNDNIELKVLSDGIKQAMLKISSY